MRNLSAISIIFLTITVVGVIIALWFFLRSEQQPPLQESSSHNESEDTSSSTEELPHAFLQYRTERSQEQQEKQSVSFIAVGDIMLSRDVDTMTKRQNDYSYPFSDTLNFLRNGDLVFGNLETPLTPGRHIATEEMTFRSDPEFAPVLRDTGFSVLSLANNHTLNFGIQGLRDTFTYLQEAGLSFVGAGNSDTESHKPAILERNGFRFAFLAYNDSDVVPNSSFATSNQPGTSNMDLERMKTDVAAAKKRTDFVIVSMHSGYEYTVEPNAHQQEFAHAAVDAGAEIVLGHHPHVVQRAEVYNGKYIFYSLGNFVFDQMWSQDTQEGLVIKVFFDNDGVTSVDLHPVLIENYAKPRFLEGEHAQHVLDRLGIDFQKQLITSWNDSEKAYATAERPVLIRDQLQIESSFVNIQRDEVFDADNNGEEETYQLLSGTLTIYENGEQTWQSPQEWWVDDFAIADSTHDGIMNINMTVWKQGDFGDAMPFWQETNDMSIKQHFFVFTYAQESMTPAWQSSNLDNPNCVFLFNDVDADTLNELVVLEGTYNNATMQCDSVTPAIWKWNDWGFYKEWEGLPGAYSHLHTEESPKLKVLFDK